MALKTGTSTAGWERRLQSAALALLLLASPAAAAPVDKTPIENKISSFLLDNTGPRALAPGRMPFHTLNPALARMNDGRAMVYGTMGGEGQPQTQAAATGI